MIEKKSYFSACTRKGTFHISTFTRVAIARKQTSTDAARSCPTGDERGMSAEIMFSLPRVSYLKYM